MKKYLVFALTILVVSGVTAILHAEEEIYWDRSTPPDATITDDDFNLDYTVRGTRSFGDQEIYDSFVVPSVDSESESSAPSSASAEMAPTPIPPARPVVRSNVLPRDRAVTPAARRLPSEEPSVQRATPKPAETSPGAEVQSIIPRNEESKRGSAVQAAGSEADRPVTKKMRWGQNDGQKAEQKAEDKSETKFQWGRQRQ
jgi:hypothetical protein